MKRPTLMTWIRAASLVVIIAGLLVSGHIGLYGQADDDDTLTVRARRGEDIDTMDPAHHTGNEEYNLNLAIYSHLMKYEPRSSEVTMDAAEEFEVSEDGLSATFKLKEGIQFHHGYGEMTAEDVKFSFERIIDPETDSAYTSDWSTLERVEVTGKYTGKLVFSEPLAFLTTTTIPYTSGAIISKDAYEDRGDRFATDPVGSGPYYWADWQPNQKMVLERFDDYYGEAPDYERIEVLPIVDDSSAEVAFDRGELDVTSISLDSVDRYRGQDDVNLQELTNLRYHWVGFNVTEEPFDDVRVRRAVRYAVDVDEIIAGAYNNVPSRNDCMLPDEILGHWDDCPSHEVDLDEARSLLEDAGYPDGFDTQIITAEPQYQIDAAQIVQQQLRKIGINAEIRVVEDGYATLREGPPGMHYYSFSLSLDPGYWMTWFTCDQVGKWNLWQWCNEEFDQLKAEGDTTISRERRAEIYVQMQQLIEEEVPAISVTNGASAIVSRPDVDPVYLAQYAQYQYFKKATSGE